MEERNKSIKKKQDGADSARLRGNAHFKRREYTLALDKYFEALKLLPYEAKTLLNIAQVRLHQPLSTSHSISLYLSLPHTLPLSTSLYLSLPHTCPVFTSHSTSLYLSLP